MIASVKVSDGLSRVSSLERWLKPISEKLLEMLLGLSLRLTIAVAGEELTVGQAGVPHPPVTVEHQPSHHDRADQRRLEPRRVALFQPMDARLRHPRSLLWMVEFTLSEVSEQVFPSETLTHSRQLTERYRYGLCAVFQRARVRCWAPF